MKTGAKAAGGVVAGLAVLFGAVAALTIAQSGSSISISFYPSGLDTEDVLYNGGTVVIVGTVVGISDGTLMYLYENDVKVSGGVQQVQGGAFSFSVTIPANTATDELTDGFYVSTD